MTGYQSKTDNRNTAVRTVRGERERRELTSLIPYALAATRHENPRHTTPSEYYAGIKQEQQKLAGQQRLKQ
ncbi:hypothetical protein JW826_04900 [Candidatus Woesearchaeota archaeon]|nr:hypothetical protein [Candidatus Woesearchaeota archaeon]